MGLFDKRVYKKAERRSSEKRRAIQRERSVGLGGRRRQEAIDSQIDRMVRGQSTDAQNSKY